MDMPTRSSYLAPLLAFGLIALANAQEPVEVGQEPEPGLLERMGMDSPQEEMKRLFHEVELTLHAIDVELSDAGAGDIPLAEGKESGMDKLLRSTREKGQNAVDGIDRILEIAQQLSGQSSGSCMRSMMGQGEPKSSGESPLDQERQRGPTQGEKTPEAPQGEKPQGEGKDPKPEPRGERPDDKGPNPLTGKNQPAPPPVDEGGAPVPGVDDAERWGTLPERVQQVFKNQITDDLPIQYRDWIDSYYRRLNRVR